jgi:hypothetical protein
MVGCGEASFSLDAETKEDAIKEAYEIVKERTHEECTFASIWLMETVENLSYMAKDVAEASDERRKERELNEKKAKLKELKAELGEV